MANVYDLIADFYTQDEEWNTVLRQSYVENFFRQKAWQGAADDELVQAWDYIMVLCIYLGNSENFLGDMTRRDFVDCVGWCARNVSGFLLTPKNIGAFFDTIIELYAHLKKKRVITDDTVPAAAKAQMLVNGKVQCLDENGYYLPEYERYNAYSTPDLPAKIFLDIGDSLQDLLSALQTFFGAKKYQRDIERATFLYGGILLSGVVNEKPGSDEYAQCFWDYFLFDYHMIDDDKTPLRHFYDSVEEIGFSAQGQVSRDVLLELLQTELVLFSVDKRTEDGLYACRNILTGEHYVLMLPIEDDLDTTDFVFLGHIFYCQTMVLNFVRGMEMPQSSRKRFLKVLSDSREWVAVRHGGKLSWADFIKRNPMFVRHLSLLYSAYVRLDGFNYTSPLLKATYAPQPAADDAVSRTIREMMQPYAFSAYDMHLAQTMWADYLAASGRNSGRIRVPQLWASGIISNFVALNGVYNYDEHQISEMCYGVPLDSMRRTGDAIRRTLQIGLHDPRYINEEGLLLMLLS